MIFDKLDRLMSETIDFVDSNINSMILYFFSKKSQLYRLRFEPTTLGSDFSIIIFSVLAVTATQLLEYDEVYC
jgi:hypothetical protein